MPGSVHDQEPQENDQSMMDAEPEVTDPILLDEKRIVVVRTIPLTRPIRKRNMPLTVSAPAPRLL
jgi:hypothetical protein